tara:strand:+ start:1078 stop:2010 length:933 start_codon:yes stop_codon:yes gene_type:complete
MFSVVFPGQGSQKIAMAKDLFQSFNLVKNIFSDADKILDLSISKIIFEGPQEQLNLTENAQPAIFLVSYSIFKLAKEEYGFEFNNAQFAAGHSLGEYSALCCFDILNFEEVLVALKKRGQFMQQAVPNKQGGMMAVLGSDLRVVENILRENIKKYECFIANDNSPQQVVVSGLKDNLDKFSEDLNKYKIKNLDLNVSAPFHCVLMKKATEHMSEVINNLKINKISKPIIHNYNAKPSTSEKDIKNMLISQIEGKVRWVESIKYMINNGTNNFVEIGPGKVLSGLIKRIDKNVKIKSINNIIDIKEVNLDG